MIKNALSLFLLFILISCRNPFLTYYDACSDGLNELNAEVQNESEEIKTSRVQISLTLPFKDIPVKTTKIGRAVELSIDTNCDFYQWIMGGKIICNEKVCLINLENFPEDIYPVEFYGNKNGMIYSGMVYITCGEKSLSVKSARTILPCISKSELTEVKLYVLNTADGKEEVFNFTFGAQLEKEKFLFTPGIYDFFLETQKGALKFCGHKIISLEKGNNKTDLPLMLQSASSETGSFSINAVFPEDTAIDEIRMKFMKKSSDGFKMIEEKKLSDGGLKFQEKENGSGYIEYNCQNLIAGLYYVDIEAFAQKYKKQSVYTSYIYVLPETESSKTVTLSDFFTLYSLSYKMNGGFFLGENLPQRITSLDSFVLPEEEQMFRAGYKFSGWFLDDSAKNPAQESYEPGEIRENMVFFGLWKEDSTTKEIGAGAGLLEGRKCNVRQEEKELVIDLPLEQSADYCLIDVYDSFGKPCIPEYKELKIKENNTEIRLGIKFLPEKDYLIEIKVFNKSLKDDSNTVTKQFWEKQVMRALSN